MLLASAAGQCQACCFYRLIELDSGGARELCALTGEKRPLASMNGCRFIPGQFAELDSILGLTGDYGAGNTGLPNQVKLGSGFSHNGEIVAKNKKIAIVDFVGNTPIKHTRKGSFARPEYREAPVAHLARERARLPFFTFKTRPSEAFHEPRN